MRDPLNMKEVANLLPQYLGFIFYKGSKRYAGDLSATEMKALPPEIIKTGVFVNEPIDTLLAIASKYQLQALQLHGSEPPEDCFALKAKLPEVEIIKAFGIDEHFDFNSLSAYADVVNFFLFDTQTPAHGGSGKLFDWALLKSYTLKVPFFLSGGIGPESVAELQQVEHQQLYAIDINSKFEIAPGLKDFTKLKQFKIELFH